MRSLFSRTLVTEKCKKTNILVIRLELSKVLTFATIAILAHVSSTLVTEKMRPKSSLASAKNTLQLTNFGNFRLRDGLERNGIVWEAWGVSGRAWERLWESLGWLWKP